MKANGKNLLMVSYYTHDYMDPAPEQSFRTIESKERFDEFVKCMKAWSGTIYGYKELTPQEYFDLRNSDYWHGYENQLDHLALDCPQDWIDEYNTLLNTLKH